MSAALPAPTIGLDPSDPAWFGDEVDLASAYADPPPPRDDVIHGLEPGNVACLGAPGGGSKTFFVLALVHDLAFGGAVTSVATMLAPAKAQPSLILTAEESVGEIRRRLHDIGALLKPEQRAIASEHAKVRSLRRNVPVLIDRDGAVVRETYDQIERASDGKRLVVLDPLGRFVRADKNDEATMVTLVIALEKIAQKNGCVFLVPHHTGKMAQIQGYGDSANALKGSTALVDSCRQALMLFRPSRKIAEQRHIDSARYRLLKIDKANYRPDKEEIWFRVRPENGTLEFDAEQTHDADIAHELGRKKSRAKIGSIAPACAAAGDDLPTLAEYIDGLH